MKFWLTTDTHLGHQKLIDLGVRKPGYDEDIMEGLNQLKPGDTLIHLGDFCMGNDAIWHKAFMDFMDHKQVKRWLVKGNHDRKSITWYLDHGWDFVAHDFTLNYHGKRILFSHIPQKLARESTWDFNVHGHFHNNDHRHAELPFDLTPYHKLLAIENTHMQPVTLESFLG